METKALRQKILDLAIRGKLVPQDPNDEPASVLLERIRAEKERLIAEGKIKRPKKSKASSSESHYQNFTPPFPIPDSWEWVRLEEIAYVASGSTPAKEYFKESGIPYLKMYNLRNQKIDFLFKPQYITKEIHNGKLAKSKAYSGDLIMNIVGPPLGKLAIIPNEIAECNFNQAAVVIRPYSEKNLINKYLFYYLSQMSEINSITTKGTAGQDNISLTQSQNMRIPVPPLCEMYRLVSKLDQYEELIGNINDNALSIRSKIGSIKSKILELAMQGKLVPQDPADEPAADMLRRVNPKARIITDNPHYPQLPDNWCSISILDCGNSALGKTLDREKNEGSTVPYICALNVQDGWFDLSTIKHLRLREHEKERYSVYKGDLMICEGGDVGRCAIWDQEPIFYQNALHRLRPHEGINTVFISLVLSHYRSNGWIEDLCSGVTIKHFTQKSMSKMIIGLPPTKEQDRIVKEVNRIFSTLDRIMLNLSDLQLYQVSH